MLGLEIVRCGDCMLTESNFSCIVISGGEFHRVIAVTGHNMSEK